MSVGFSVVGEKFRRFNRALRSGLLLPPLTSRSVSIVSTVLSLNRNGFVTRNVLVYLDESDRAAGSHTSNPDSGRRASGP